MSKSNIATSSSTGTLAREPETARPETGAGDSAVAMLVLSSVLLIGVAGLILSSLFRNRAPWAARVPMIEEPAPAR
jgi:hypothetical protein